MIRIRLTLVIIIGTLFITCNSKQEISDNYLLVNTIIKKTKEQVLDKTLVFKLDNNNEYVILILNKLYRYELDNDKYKLDSLKQDLGIIKDEILDSIFNKEQYEYLISQKHNSQWDLNLIDTLYLKKSNDNSERMLQVSKPIYTPNNKTALICINRGTFIGISIYKNIEGKWEEYRLIAPLLVQPKVERFN